MTSWKLWLDGDAIEFDIPTGDYIVSPEIVLEAVVRRLGMLGELERARVVEEEFPGLTELTSTIKDVEVMSGVLGAVCRERGIERVSTKFSGCTSPRIGVRYMVDFEHCWLVIKLMHRIATDQPLLSYWIFGRRVGEEYKHFPVPELYGIGENGEVWLEYDGHDTFELGILKLHLLLDRGRAIAIGLIREALEDNDARVVKSLKKCPHPYKRYGIEMAELLEVIESVLMEE
jgi:hypothetical protein